MNSGQLIQLHGTGDHEPKATIYIYGEEEITPDDEDGLEVRPVIYLNYSDAHQLASRLLDVARLVTPAK